MNEAIERGARALYKFELEKPRYNIMFDFVKTMYGDPPIEFDGLCNSVKEEFRAQARAVLEAKAVLEAEK